MKYSRRLLTVQLVGSAAFHVQLYRFEVPLYSPGGGGVTGVEATSAAIDITYMLAPALV